MRVLISGDWIEGRGELIQNEIHFHQVQLLSPNLTDRGHRSEVNKAFREWRHFIKQVENFFDNRGFDFLSTPTLVACPGTEPFLEPFSTKFIYGSCNETLYLPTSPELHLKKCLAKGWDKIYEIRPCFRNGELSKIHQPEFYLLEWYRAFASTTAIQEDIKNLLHMLDPESVSHPWVSLSMSDLFQKFLNFNLQPTTTREDLVHLGHQHGLDLSQSLDFDDAFFFLFIEKIEPYLNEFKKLFLHSYPPSQAALARLTTEGWGDRFEFYMEGIEIANAFNELNNPQIQRIRSAEDLSKKRVHGKASLHLDEDFFWHLERGMPPSSGIALGLDRLFMVLKGYTNISDFRLFPKCFQK